MYDYQCQPLLPMEVSNSALIWCVLLQDYWFFFFFRCFTFPNHNVILIKLFVVWENTLNIFKKNAVCEKYKRVILHPLITGELNNTLQPQKLAGNHSSLERKVEDTPHSYKYKNKLLKCSRRPRLLDQIFYCYFQYPLVTG